MDSFFWHDYETFGIDPRRDRIAQFAGVRTDASLEIVDEPVVAWCRIADDYLPDPAACLVTGITPQMSLERGVIEAEFAAIVHEQLSAPGTCALGYNSIRFDDEFTRFLLYRNFFEPYAREWQYGNSRWDLIDTLRLAHALRPQGINWPVREDGSTSFKLEELTVANDIEHGDAHDALADVKATISMARLLRDAQPRLFDFAFQHRDKRKVANMLAPYALQPVLHVSGKYAARNGCIAPVVALAELSQRETVVFDLREDPSALIELAADEIAARVFTPADELPEDTPRIPLKSVHLNRAPVVAPFSTLTPLAIERWQIDPERSARHLETVTRHAELITAKMHEVFRYPERTEGVDAELALYEQFIDDRDRDLLPEVRAARSRSDFDTVAGRLSDKRFPELLFRYRARNFPQTLSADEETEWKAQRRARLLDGDETRTLATLDGAIREAMSRDDLDDKKRNVLQQLRDYAALVGTTVAGNDRGTELKTGEA